jgi:hypothetical protein
MAVTVNGNLSVLTIRGYAAIRTAFCIKGVHLKDKFVTRDIGKVIKWWKLLYWVKEAELFEVSDLIRIIQLYEEEERTILRAYSFLAILTSNTWPCLPGVIVLRRRMNLTGEFLLGKAFNLCPTRGGKGSLSVVKAHYRWQTWGYRLLVIEVLGLTTYSAETEISISGVWTDFKYIQHVRMIHMLYWKITMYLTLLPRRFLSDSWNWPCPTATVNIIFGAGEHHMLKYIRYTAVTWLLNDLYLL